MGVFFVSVVVDYTWTLNFVEYLPKNEKMSKICYPVHKRPRVSVMSKKALNILWLFPFLSASENILFAGENKLKHKDDRKVMEIYLSKILGN